MGKKRGPYNVKHLYKNGFPGERYGRLVIQEEIPADSRKERCHREFICKCDCGKTKRVKGDNLFYGNTRSCGCLRSEGKTKKARETRKQRVIWNRFGKLVAVEECLGENYRISYKCICDCGNERIVSNYSLISGTVKSCGCIENEEDIEKDEIIAGKTFNELTAIKRAEDRIDSNGRRHRQWLFQCSCGKQRILSPYNVINGKIKSCGHVGSSYAENQIANFLEMNDIKFKKEATFSDLKNPETGRRFKFDFKIYRNDGSFFLVEHQGKQHFFEIKHDKNFGKQQREVTDKIKRNYCKTHGITLYETLYNEDYMAKLNEIIRSELERTSDEYEREVRESG